MVGALGPPTWKTRFTQNFTLVSNYIIDLLFKWIPYVGFDTFFGGFWCPCQGPLNLKKCNFGKIENGRQCPCSASKKKVLKQKSLVSMSYNWSVSKFLPSDQNLVHQSQKIDFTPFHTSWCPLMKANIFYLRSKPGALEPKN